MSNTDAVLPPTWKVTDLAELVDRLQYGYTARAKDNSDGPRFLRITDIGPNGVDWNTVPGCNVTDADLAKYRLYDGDIVFARSGSIEKAWRVEVPPKAVFASYLIRGRPVAEWASSWLKHFTRSNDYLGQIGAAGAGLGMQNVSAKKLGALILPIPPLAEQRRIVAKIEALQERSRKARAALAEVGPLLEQFRQSLLAAAFRGDLTADWRAAHPDVEPASELLARIHTHDDGALRRRRVKKRGGVSLPDELFHDLPESWSYASVDECLAQGLIIDFVDGNHGALYPRKTNFGRDGVVFITAKQINEGNVDFYSAPRLADNIAATLQKGWAKGGDVLLTHNATVGRVGRVPLDLGAFLLGTSVTYYRCNHAILDRDYLFHSLSAPQWQGQLHSVMEQTTRNQVSIQKQAFFRLPIAPVDEQREIARQLDAFSIWCKSVRESIFLSRLKMDQLDQSILAKAFRGELVPQDPADESAAVLLERIRQQREAQAAAQNGQPKRRARRKEA